MELHTWQNCAELHSHACDWRNVNKLHININFLCRHCTGKMITLGEGRRGGLHDIPNTFLYSFFQNKTLMEKLSQENPQAPTRLTHWGWQWGRHTCPPESGSSCAWSLPASGPTRTAGSKGRVRRGWGSSASGLTRGPGKRDSQQVPIGSSHDHPFSHLKSNTLKSGTTCTSS